MLNDYMMFTRETAVYPTNKELEYLSLGLTNEAGEVAGKVKKWMRRDPKYSNTLSSHKYSDALIEDLEGEIGDVFWYLVRLCDALCINPEQVIQTNIDKLSKRKGEGKLKGDGDNR